MFTVLPFTPSPSWSLPATASGSGHRGNVDMDIDDNQDDDNEHGFDPNDLEDSTRDHITTPGETIASFQQYMRGHGTYVEKDLVVSSTAGTIERVNKLISVKAIGSRYNPEIGDLVVGRITDVQARRWKVEIGSRQDAILMLAAVNLPGGVQRRKLESDELEMRTYFEEGDLLVAEVQQITGDGSTSLHTRSLRYGKLRNGMLVTVTPPTLIRRLQSHFFSLPCGVDVILGLNGYVWVMKHVDETNQLGEEGFDAQAIYSNKNDVIDTPTRNAIVLVASIIRALASGFVPLSDIILNQAYEWTIDHSGNKSAALDLLSDELGQELVAAASAWI